MKFKIDENLPVELAEVLIGAAHDAATVYSEKLQGESDDTISTVCQREGRILITMDVDFTDIFAYPPHRYPGFLVLRPHH